MLRLRAKTASLWQRVVGRRIQNAVSEDPLPANSAIVARAIHARASLGQPTTMRQLHKITGLSQSEAFRAVAELEQTEMLHIERDHDDAFEWTIILGDAVQANIGHIARCDAA